ncbi:hypothetical protein P9204_04410 [Geobacillus stearothermophilus]|nr:hypothetical protein [Geobacillus stearothermophilus]
MADKNIQMTQRNASNTGWDNLYPITKASNVQVTPISGLSGTDVQTVLQNLFQFANDGKTAVANAITAKGVSASPTETFASLAAKIGQISTGKKWAAGKYTPSASTLPFYKDNGTTYSCSYVTISGLDFKPSIIILDFQKSRRTSFFANGDWNNSGRDIHYVYWNGGSPSTTIFQLASPAVVDYGTFTLPFPAQVQLDWIAIE